MNGIEINGIKGNKVAKEITYLYKMVEIPKHEELNYLHNLNECL